MSRWTIFVLEISRHPAYYPAYLHGRKQAEQSDAFSPMNVASRCFAPMEVADTLVLVVSLSGIVRATSNLIFLMRQNGVKLMLDSKGL